MWQDQAGNVYSFFLTINWQLTLLIRPGQAAINWLSNWQHQTDGLSQWLTTSKHRHINLIYSKTSNISQSKLHVQKKGFLLSCFLVKVEDDPQVWHHHNHSYYHWWQQTENIFHRSSFSSLWKNEDKTQETCSVSIRCDSGKTLDFRKHFLFQ